MEPRWEPGGEAIDGESFEAVIASEPIVLIHFWAEWDAYDRQLDHVLVPIRAEFAGRVCFRSADIDRPDLVPFCHALGVANVPTLAGFVRGRKALTLVGPRPKAELRALVAGMVNEHDRETMAAQTDASGFGRW